MVIGLVIYGSLETISGGFLYDRQLVQALEAQGDKVAIISLPWQAYGLCLAHNFWPRLRRHLLTTPYDLILQDELNHPSLVALNRTVKAITSTPIVSIVHHLRASEWRPAWQNALYRQVERAYLQGVDGFVYNSATTRAVVEGLVAPKPCVVATLAGDRFAQTLTAEDVAARAHRPGPLRLLFVGNLQPRKGLPTLLQALALLPPGTAELAVVGGTAVDRATMDSLQQTFAGLPFTFLGALNDEPLAAQYRQSHVLVVPSSYEGFGIVYLEGMGFGLTAVGTTAGGAGEIITHGENGFLVPPHQPQTLANHLLALAQDRTLLARMGQAALKRFASYPTWAQSMATAVDFLHTMG